MKKRHGRRQCDNGWRGVIRDYGFGVLAITIIFSSGVLYSAVANNTKELDRHRERPGHPPVAERIAKMEGMLVNIERDVSEIKSAIFTPH